MIFRLYTAYELKWKYPGVELTICQWERQLFNVNYPSQDSWKIWTAGSSEIFICVNGNCGHWHAMQLPVGHSILFWGAWAAAPWDHRYELQKADEKGSSKERMKDKTKTQELFFAPNVRRRYPVANLDLESEWCGSNSKVTVLGSKCEI